MIEKSWSEPRQRTVLLDEGSERPIAVDAEAFLNFEAAFEKALNKLLARWEMSFRSVEPDDRRRTRPAK